MKSYQSKTKRAQIVAGDVLEAMRTLESETVDVVLTDPPYSSGTRKEGQKGVRKSMNRGERSSEWFDSDSLTVVGFLYLLRQVGLEIKRVLKPGGHALMFIDWRMSPHLTAAIESVDLQWVDVLVWDKLRMGMGSQFRRQHEFVLHFTKGVGSPPARRDCGNVLAYAPVRAFHPTQKPVALLSRILSVVAKPDSLVIDPFVGSGSTLIAGLRGGHRVWGCEREPTFFDYAARRVDAFDASTLEAEVEVDAIE